MESQKLSQDASICAVIQHPPERNMSVMGNRLFCGVACCCCCCCLHSVGGLVGALVTPTPQHFEPQPSSVRLVDIRPRYWIAMVISTLVCGGLFAALAMHSSSDLILFGMGAAMLLPFGQVFVSLIVLISIWTLQPAQRPAARKQLASLSKRALLGTFCGSIAMVGLFMLASLASLRTH